MLNNTNIQEASHAWAEVYIENLGWVGFDISNIRPRGLSCENAARSTDGIELFMERFSNSCREVAQGGRRGALMLSISVHHPQVLDFINDSKIAVDLGPNAEHGSSINMTSGFIAIALAMHNLCC